MGEKSVKTTEAFQKSTESNQLVTNQEYEVLKQFLFKSEPDFHYPTVQENEKLYYVLAGMVIGQLLEKKYGNFALRKMGEYLGVRSLKELKDRLLYLVKNSIHLIDDIHFTTPIAKSLYVLFITDMKCLSTDQELKNCYTIGMFTTHIRIV
ncbi:hypothetical protein P4U99_26685 [Brevibacillus agri]|uniref:hypothetical protein n=1 Tax=Brevibacillus TaxID=55080 RepID=UPI001EE4F1A1|nr:MULTISPECIES: hypothetical protein [Brevibacillus]MCG5252450.1 hypothetical protein [Brevibacillus agri]MCM3472210.1 hypothetical protein [Brevibacillus borstelensis]MED1646701.1 hypothetical protein [Brevibacillus agri]MED1657698.1 hypothetical protein [Brevibacillus agri]MED1689499.1 hypothetical protein [Brevibacillus agri]